MTMPTSGGISVEPTETYPVAAPERRPAERGTGRYALSVIVGVVLVATSTQSSASPLPGVLFDHLAVSCAPGIQLRTLKAVAAVESNFDPWAVQDNAAHRTWSPSSLSNAVALASARLKMGHSVDVGLMQINSRNLASLGITLGEAFDPCHSMSAASRILSSAYAAGSSEPDRQAAILIALSRYNTGQPLAGIANGYVAQVVAKQRSTDFQPAAMTGAPAVQQAWEVWGSVGAQAAPWLITGTESYDFERAGVKPINARVDEHAAVPPLAKGEPYELLAYKENQTPN
jgi:type IV secretion system protein VirB1